MTTELTVAEPPADQPAGTVGVSPAVLATLEASAGDAVELRGDRRTVAVLARDEDAPEDVARLDETTRENAGAGLAGAVRIRPVEAATADSVTVAPTQDLEVRGDDAVRDVLTGRVLVAGDRVRVPLFGGALTLSVRVVETDPPGVVRVGEETAVTVRDRPAGSIHDADGEFRRARLDDVAGLEDTVDRLLELVALPLTHPEVYRRFATPPQTGVLLHGPSGAGKTLIARAMATEVDAHTVTVSCPAVAARPTDDAADRLADIRREAVSEAPTLVVLDDVEAVAPADASGSDRRLVARLTAVLDALADREDVVVLATAADPGEVAEELRRGGRFEVELPVGAPDRDGRAAVLEVLTREVPLADDVDLEAVADRTHGFLGADLRALVTEAVAHGARRVVADAGGARPVPHEVLADAVLTAEDLAAGVAAVDPSGLRASRVEVPEVGYDDVGGLAPAKRELARAIEWPLAHPEMFAATGVEAPSGVLLYGPPGTGKTLLAKAVANATDANFVSIAGPEVLNRYVGESEAAVRRTFETARQHSPAVVFIDEVDAITPRRGEGGDSSGAAERVVSQLLTELDGLEPLEDVVVVAATNRPDTIDPALLRPGRLERLVEVPLPDETARREILGVHTREVPLADDVDLDALAARTDRYNGSDLEALVREAGLLAIEAAVDEGASPDTVRVTADHLDRALAGVRPSVSAEMREYYERQAEEFGGPEADAEAEPEAE